MSSIWYTAVEIGNELRVAARTKPFVVAGVGFVGCVLLLWILSGLWGYFFDSATSDLSRVSGTVTVAGVPVAGVQVRFEPLSGGVASHGLTAANGRYELQAGNGRRGAVVGRHIVRLTTGELVRVPGDGEAFEVVNETIAQRYNVESELVADIVEGANNCDWKIDSK